MERIVVLEKWRDKQAAHGGFTGLPSRALAWHDLVIAHWTAWYCIYERVEHLAGATND